jgi:hypothetical protein
LLPAAVGQMQVLHLNCKRGFKKSILKFPSGCLAMRHQEESDPMKKAFDLPKKYE